VEHQYEFPAIAYFNDFEIKKKIEKKNDSSLTKKKKKNFDEKKTKTNSP